MKYGLLGLFALAVLQPLHAQDSTTVLPVDTLAITITRATAVLPRVPAAVSVVTRERIQAGRLGLTLDEALVDVPGVLVNNRYNFSLGTRISLRGFGARAAFGVRGIRLIADGIPLTMPDGQSNLNNIDLTSVGRIEVLRGAASMLHGNAAGGVIELRSEQPPPGFAMEARAVAADLGRGGLGDLARFNVKAGGGSDRTRYLLSAAHASGDGSREHASFEQTNVTARVERLSPNQARTAFTLSLADAPIAENPGSLPRDSAALKPHMAWPRNIATRAREQSRQLQAGVQHARHIGSAVLDATVYGLTRTLDNPLPFAYITLDRRAGGVRSTFGTAHVVVGVDVEAQADERAEFNNDAGNRGLNQRRDQTDRIVSIGPFVRLLHDFTPRLSAAGGVRYDRARFEVEDRFLTDGRDDSGERTLSAFSPSLGFTYQMAPANTLFASVSTSFQTPTTTEMINAPPAPGEPCCAAGFNDLDPERALSFEVGFRGRLSARVSMAASMYQMRVRDAIVPFQVAAAEGREFFRNAGRTRHRGVELTATTAVTRAVGVTASYTYSDFMFEDDGIDGADYEGNRVPGVPPHHALLRAVLRNRYVVLEPEAEFTSSYFADDANTENARNEAVTVYNVRLRAARSLGPTRLQPFAALTNLMDERYNSSVVINAAGARYFEPAPGRSFYVGLAFAPGS